jgi:Flp pilus assembly protein TadG
MRIAEHQNTLRKGQALVEFALILPLLFLLIVNVVNFGAFFFAWITVANAARSGAQYMCLGGASVGFLKKDATSAQIYNLVSADISSLRNRSSLAVRNCTQNSGVAAVCTTTGSGTFTNPAADIRTEAPLYVMGWVDVQYTYVPLIPVFSFSKLGIHATLPPLTIHRQSVMRIIQ